jgi:hypothetical protein
VKALLHVAQVVALLVMIGATVGAATWLARAATPGLDELLNRYGPTVATLGLRLRDKLTRRRK